MGIGILLYEINAKYSHKLKSRILAATSFAAMLSALVMSFFTGGIYDYTFVILISFGILISFNTELRKFRHIIEFFDKITYSLYLNHIVIRTYFIPMLFDKLNATTIVVYLIIVTLLSIVANYLMRSICESVFAIESKYSIFKIKSKRRN